MKKLLKSLLIYEDDARSMIYRLTSLQANGYLEDISFLFLEERESREGL
ncbi:ribosome-binding factor A [Streptococcus sp. H31]